MIALATALAVISLFLAAMSRLALHPPEQTGELADDKPKHGWTVAWMVWLVVTIGGFALIEGPAIANSEGGDTFTEHIQFVAGQSPLAAVLGVVGLIAFGAWFLPHLFGRGSRVWVYLDERRQPKGS